MPYFNARRNNLFASAFANQIVKIENGIQKKLSHGNLESQRTILDDSTKTIYGMNTSKYMSKDNFLLGDTTFITLDSSLTNIEIFSHEQINQFTYQSLWNIGTPINNIFNYYPSTFSVSSGINSLNYYYLVSSEAKFYDTKSPYIDLSLFFGGNGRSMVDFVFSRNINKNWNIGFDIHRISADKQISASKAKGDKNINSSLFKFSRCTSKETILPTNNESDGILYCILIGKLQIINSLRWFI